LSDMGSLLFGEEFRIQETEDRQMLFLTTEF
jgi:hypothetical protein